MSDQVVFEACRNFDIDLIDVAINTDYPSNVSMPEDHFANRSFCIGPNTVILGIYEDAELRLASFFHEVGHLVNKDGDQLGAWGTGLDLAASLGVVFSKETLSWCQKQAKTYDL